MLCRADMERAKSEVQLAAARQRGSGQRDVKRPMDSGGPRKILYRSPTPRKGELYAYDPS
jgi:hypothetical protein